MKNRIEKLKQKIKSMEIELNPCLTMVEIEMFEKEHGIKFPEDYRQFLLDVGNGGGSLENNMAALGELVGSTHEELKKLWRNYPNINKPFPFTETWIWKEKEWEDEEGQPVEEFWNKYDSVTNGSLYLADTGCGQYWLLIITGTERGNIWTLTHLGIFPTFPKRDFLTWYEDMLGGKEINVDFGHWSRHKK